MQAEVLEGVDKDGGGGGDLGICVEGLAFHTAVDMVSPNQVILSHPFA